MGFIRVIIAAGILMTIPAILESCCFYYGCGCGGGDGPARYDFEDMSMSTTNNTTSVVPRLSEVKFQVEISAKYSMMTRGGSSVYACEPAPPTANQKISSIEITSDHDLITDLGTVQSGLEMGFLFSVRSYRRNGPLHEILNEEFLGDFMEFVTDTKLADRQQHSFMFRITLDNGQVFEMSTPILNLAAG